MSFYPILFQTKIFEMLPIWSTENFHHQRTFFGPQLASYPCTCAGCTRTAFPFILVCCKGHFSGFWWWLPTNLQKIGAHTNSTTFLKVGSGDTNYHGFQLRPTPHHTQIMACRKWINVGSIPQNSGGSTPCGSTPLPLPREKEQQVFSACWKKFKLWYMGRIWALIPSLEQNPELHSFCV